MNAKRDNDRNTFVIINPTGILVVGLLGAILIDQYSSAPTTLKGEYGADYILKISGLLWYGWSFVL